MSSRITQQWLTFSRMWYLVDAYQQPPGRLAAMVTPFLTGKNKPIYHPLSDVGDHVVIINTKHVAFSKDKWKEKIYHHHTGYPKGFKSMPAYKLHEQDPKKVVHKAIYGMLPKDLRRRTMMCRLHLFEDDNIPEDMRENIVEQIKGPREIPRTLREYTPEELAAFPKLWYPMDPLKRS